MLGGPGSTMGGRRGCAERCGDAEPGGGRGEQRGAAAAPPFISSRGRPRPVPSRSAPFRPVPPRGEEPPGPAVRAGCAALRAPAAAAALGEPRSGPGGHGGRVVESRSRSGWKTP